MAILAAITNGGLRRELDYYRTPPAATLALLPLIENWPREIWEPACGDGAISKVLEASGFIVDSFDLVERGFGKVQDFFDMKSPVQNSIISNPPYALAHDFIGHAYELGVQRMALLLKSNFFSTRKSLDVWTTWRPRIIAPLTWRLDFTGAGAPHTDTMWVLWSGLAFETSFQPLRKPGREKDSAVEEILIETGLHPGSKGVVAMVMKKRGMTADDITRLLKELEPTTPLRPSDKTAPKTLFDRQQTELDESGGRYAKRVPSTLTGTTPTPQYPQIPSGPWSGADPVPPEEPLGFDVNALDPVGTPAEVQASLNRVPEEK